MFSNGLARGSVASYCELRNEASGFINSRQFPNQMIDCHLQKTYYVCLYVCMYKEWAIKSSPCTADLQ
jgi:hypothetical protein